MTDVSAAISTMFDRNVDLAAPLLREPATREIARARRIYALLVETLGGYAFGTVAGQLVRATAQWFGAEQAALVRAAVVSSTRKPVERFSEHAVAAVLAHAPVVLGHEMLAALRTRLSLAVLDLAKLVAATEAHLPRELSRTSGSMFSELKRDSVFEDRLSVEITTGWAHACAVIDRARLDLPEASLRSRDLWNTWSRLAGQPWPVEARDPARRDGYIARVG